MATDLPEFLGGAIGLSLIFQIPLVAGMTVTAVIVYAMLALNRSGFRPLELIMGGFVEAIALSYLAEVILGPVSWRSVPRHVVMPQIADRECCWGVGIIGATVMSHAIYLHSALPQARIPARNDVRRKRLIRASNGEVMITLSLAGLVNGAMVFMALAVSSRS
jgi:manganese transport protein